jgi:hypothetical protein
VSALQKNCWKKAQALITPPSTHHNDSTSPS